MNRIQRILFPVDYSRQSFLVAAAVAAMARKFDAEVTMVHVLAIPPGSAGDWYAYLNLVDVHSIRAAAQDELKYYLAGELEGVKVKRQVLEGEAAKSIVQFAADEKMDLVMMPTRGHTKFRSLLLGSVTAAVLHDAECPVWTSAHTEIDVEPAVCRSILCAVDLSPSTPGVLRWAGELARAWDAKLSAVHALPPPSGADALAAARGNARTLFAPLAQEAGLSIELDIGAGPPAEVVRVAAARHNADLIVAGRGKIQGAFGRLRNDIHEIIRRSPCPVLSV